MEDFLKEYIKKYIEQEGLKLSNEQIEKMADNISGNEDLLNAIDELIDTELEEIEEAEDTEDIEDIENIDDLY